MTGPFTFASFSLLLDTNKLFNPFKWSRVYVAKSSIFSKLKDLQMLNIEKTNSRQTLNMTNMLKDASMNSKELLSSGNS